MKISMLTNNAARRLTTMLIVGALVALTPMTSSAATVWDGPELDFQRLPFVDGSLAENQDALSDTVIFARLGTRGLFNAASEDFFDKPAAGVELSASPAGTLWAFSGLNGNPTGVSFSASNFANLSFSAWTAALGGPPALAANIGNRPAVVHLVAKDIYLDVTFTSWGVGPGSGAFFAYTRSTPSAVPLPVSLPLLAFGLMCLRRIRRQ